MSKNFFRFLTVMAVLFSLSTARVGMSGAMPEPGDGVYRDMNTGILLAKIVGHAGICIGNFEVIHMQKPRCEKTALTNFYPDYWGSFYAGNNDAAKKRVDEAKRLLKAKVKYSFWDYKSFDDKKNPRGRCDGLGERCYEIAGNDIVKDYHWSSLTPQAQWKSSKITSRYTTALGKTTRNSPLVSIASWADSAWIEYIGVTSVNSW